MISATETQGGEQGLNIYLKAVATAWVRAWEVRVWLSEEDLNNTKTSNT